MTQTTQIDRKSRLIFLREHSNMYDIFSIY